jgi:hypothetical protein
MKIVLWGTGSVAKKIFAECMTLAEYEIQGFIDNDENKEGSLFCGYLVYRPKILNDLSVDAVVILTDSYDEIKKQIITEYPMYADRIHNKNFFYKQSIIKRYENTLDKDILEVLNYLKYHDLDVFNYDFVNKYKKLPIDVYFDDNNGMRYVIYNNNRMYFPSKFDSDEKVINYYRQILLEQDIESPHRYLTEEFFVNDDDVVIDAGVAEGNFALDVIDKVKHIYLVETDSEWVTALKATFGKYKDKVTIIEGWLSSYNEGNIITIDEIVKEKVDFIKMDIEGNEWEALIGAHNTIAKSPNIKLAICSYHSDFDYLLIKSILKEYGIQCTPSKGYMWFPYLIHQNHVSTNLVRGIIRGEKICNYNYEQ